MNLTKSQILSSSFEESDIKEQLFTSFIKENLEAIAFVDEDLRFVSANGAFCHILGLTSNSQLNQFHISILPFSKNPRFNDLVQALVNNQMSRFEMNTNHKSLDGIEKTIQLKMVRNETDGVFQGGVLMMKDVTQLHQQNLLLAAELKVVKEQNKRFQEYISEKMQLENFAYVASHDMKEPLRMIGNFSQLLSRKYKDDLDESGHEYLDFILSGVKNMNKFVDDLLVYSRTERSETVRKVINFDNLFFMLEREFSPQIEKKNATIKIDNLPEGMTGCRDKITLLIRNLMCNSLKFSKPDNPVQISLTSEDKGFCWQFSFTDNGIGIEETFFDKIFMLFKKLHPKSVCPGTGVGLALCKKIVEQHGGDIWVESVVGNGTTVHFTINKDK